MSDAAALVLDLSVPVASADRAGGQRHGGPIWTDIHDYDGESGFHRPFIEAADAIFMNADRIGDDPLPVHAPVHRGRRLARRLHARRRRVPWRSTSG